MKIARLKQPLTNEQLVELFDTGNIPAVITNKPNYMSQDLRNFYTGITKKPVITEEGVQTFKYIVKKVIVQSPIIQLPIRRGRNIIRNWRVGNYAVSNRPLVIILDVKEYTFESKTEQAINYNLIGIFDTDTFKAKLIEANNRLSDISYPFEDYSPLSGEETNDDYLVAQYIESKTRKKRVNIKKKSLEDELLEKLEPEMVEEREEKELSPETKAMANEYIDSLISSTADIEELKKEEASEETVSVDDVVIEDEIAGVNPEDEDNPITEALNSEIEEENQKEVDSIISKNIEHSEQEKRRRQEERINKAIIEEDFLLDEPEEEPQEEDIEVVEQTDIDEEDDEDLENRLDLSKYVAQASDNEQTKIQDDAEYFGINIDNSEEV